MIGNNGGEDLAAVLMQNRADRMAMDAETKHDPSNGQFTRGSGGEGSKGNFHTKSLSSWKENAKTAGHKVYENMTRRNGDTDPGYHKAVDKHGNHKGEYDTKIGEGHLEI